MIFPESLAIKPFQRRFRHTPWQQQCAGRVPRALLPSVAVLPPRCSSPAPPRSDGAAGDAGQPQRSVRPWPPRLAPARGET